MRVNNSTTKFSLILLIFFSYLIGHTQIKHLDSEPLHIEDFNLTNYNKYEGYSAIVLSDQGVSNIESDSYFNYTKDFRRVRRILILKEDGLNYANISIPFDVSKNHEVLEITGVTYNLENTRIISSPLELKNVHTEKVDERTDRKVFTLPRVKVGSIIEYSYIINIPYRDYMCWEFQSTKIPTIKSRFTFITISDDKYAFIGQGFDKFDHYQLSDKKFANVPMGQDYHEIHKLFVEFGMDNVPAFEDNGYITSVDDYIMKIEFRITDVFIPILKQNEKYISTFPDIITDLLKHKNYGMYIKACEKESKNIIEDLDLYNKNEIDKIKSVVEYVKDRIVWNGVDQKYCDSSPAKVMRDNKGSSAEINLFLIGCLRSAGFEVDPIFLSTRGNGKINRQYPFLSYFNYSLGMLTLKNGNRILLDATDTLLPFNMVPPKCFNGPGLIIKQESETWVNIQSAVSSSQNVLLKSSLDPEKGIIENSAFVRYSGYEAFNKRNEFKDDEQEVIKFFESKLEKIDDVNITGFENLGDSYILAAKGQTKVEVNGHEYSLYPLGRFPIEKNKLTAETRSFPVDMTYPKSFVYNTQIAVPEGTQLVESMRSLDIDDDLVTLKYSVSIDVNNILVNAILNFKKDNYQPDEYSILKSYIDQAVEYFNSSITIEVP